MKNKTRINSFLIFLVLTVIAVCAVVFLFFIDPKEDSFFHLNADINYDGLTGLASTDNNDITIEAGDKRDVYISFKINSDSQDDSKGVFRFDLENLDSYVEYLSMHDDGTTFEVTINKVKSTTAVLMIQDGCLYLVDALDNTKMYTLPSNTKNMSISFALPIRFADELPEGVDGQKIGIQLTGKMINSASRLNKLKTVTDFKPYFDTMTTPISYTQSLTYTLSSDGGSAILTGITDEFKGGEISIPAYAKIDGTRYVVKSIADNAFANNDTIESVWFSPDTKIQNIGNKSFYNCKKLISFTIPESITTIADNAFLQCYHLGEVLNLSNFDLNLDSDDFGKIAKYAVRISNIDWCEVVKDGDYRFVQGDDGENYLLGYMGTENQIALPSDSTYRIKNYAFNNSSYLTAVVIPSSVVSIGEDSFAYSTSLTEVDIAGGVKTIENNAFSNCQRLSSLKFAENADLFRIGESVFSNCYALQNITLPKNVKLIGANIFFGCRNLKSFTIPESSRLQSIPQNAFNGCTSLTDVNFPNSSNLVTIYDNAFRNCTMLQSITIPKYVSSIGEYAFYNCTSLTTFALAQGSTIKGISAHTFENCNTLKNVDFSNASITIIGENAFAGCSDLVQIIIPAYVNTISNDSFKNCTSLTNVVFASSSSLSSLGERAFYGCTSLATISVPYRLNSFGKYAFKGCTSLTEIIIPDNSWLTQMDWIKEYNWLSKVNIPYQITSLQEHAFSGFSNLTSVTFASNSQLESISPYAFANCTSLLSITIPKATTSIGRYAFTNCTSLNNVSYATGSLLSDLGNNVFDGCSSIVTIPIPSKLVNIGASAFTNCEKLTTIVIPDDSKLTSMDWISEYKFLVSVNIPKNITEISNGTFREFTSLRTVTFAENIKLTSIEDYAFWGCNSSMTMTLPKTLKNVGERAFYYYNKDESYTTSLKYDITIPNDMYLDSVGIYAFCRCKLNGTLHFSNKLTSVSNGAFQYSSITSVEFSDSSNIESIGDHSFCESHLTSVKMGNYCRVGSLGDYAFEDCSYLNTFSFGTGSTLNSIGRECFSRCSGFTSFIVPDGTTSIDSYAFEYCRYLTSITFPSTLTSIESGWAYECYRLAEILNLSDLDITSSYVVRNVNSSVSKVFDEGDYKYVICEDGNTYLCGQYSGSFALPTNRTYYIKPYAFYNSSIQKLEIPNNVTGVGKYAFRAYSYSDYGYIKEVVISDSVKSIDDGAFYGQDALKKITINASSSLTSIGASAFYNNRKLKSITIPKGVTTIGEDAFSGTYNLGEVINLSSLSITIGSSDYGYIAYDAVRVATSGTSTITTDGDYEFIVCDNGNRYVVDYTGSYSQVTIPSCAGICGGVFYKKSISNLTLPNGIKTIGRYAFYNGSISCDLVIPDSVISIGAYCFYYCNLKSVTISKNSNLKTIGAYAFSNNSGLITITIPSGVESIGNGCFSGCYRLAEVINYSSLSISLGSASNGHVAYYAVKIATSGDTQITTDSGGFKFVTGNDNNKYLIGYSGTMQNVTIPACYGIRYGAFYDNDTITKVTIPSSVVRIDDYAFCDCDNLTNVIFSGSSQLARIGERVFSSCDKLSSIKLPSKLTYIGEGAFAYTALTSVSIPSSVVTIDDDAFNSTKLTSLTFSGSKLTTIGGGAFAYTKLTSVTIPNSVTSIGAGAFYISTLQTFTFQSQNPPYVSYDSSFGNRIFPKNSEILTIYVPTNYYDNYINSSRCTEYVQYIKKR